MVSQSVGGSARSGVCFSATLGCNEYAHSKFGLVGGALRVNPFAPYVPCHRVVASNLYIGGFFGQWAGRKTSRTPNDSQLSERDPPQIHNKIALLKEEGVSVDSRGFLVDAGGLVWKSAESM